MADAAFPRTITRGPLKGQYFETAADYAEARAQVPEAPPESDTPPGVPNEPRNARQRRGRVDKAMVVGILFPVNVGLWMVPQTRADALTDEEIDRLSDAIVKVAAVNKWVEKAIVSGATSTAYVELAVVVGAIAIKRAANHGLLPSYLARGLDEQMGLGGNLTDPEPAANGHQATEAAPFADAYVPGGSP